jgi:hypothetical protein
MPFFKKQYKSKKRLLKKKQSKKDYLKKTIKKNFSKKQFSKKKFTKKHFKGGEFDEGLKEFISQNIQQRDENYSKMLQVACKDPDNCLALGEYDVDIKRFFDDFRNLNYIDNTSLKKIGKPSTNGFVIEVPFKKMNFTAFTVLKCSAEETADNLFYEYYVGKFFINTYLKKIPCFVETYDIYEFSSEAVYNDIQNRVSNTTNSSGLTNYDIKSYLKRIDVDETNIDNLLKLSCVKNKLLCILIQHFDRFYSFDNTYDDSFDNIKHDIFNLWYQIYFSLAFLNKDGNYNYTHYDLHANNVFLYKPFEGNKCIEMTYHRLNGKKYTFKSEYITKIIDYGRNYFNNGKTNTAEIMKKICNFVDECGSDCGGAVGYSIIRGVPVSGNYSWTGNYSWINPIEPNISHDLRAVDPFSSHLTNKKTVYSFTYQKDTGTPQNIDNKKIDNKFVITNIFNLRDALESIMVSFNLVNNPQKYNTWKVAATMNIYEDGRDYEFVVLPDTV